MTGLGIYSLCLGCGSALRKLGTVDGRKKFRKGICTQPLNDNMNYPTIQEIITPQRLLDAMHECENNVRWKASVQRFEINTLRWAATLRSQVLSGKFAGSGFRSFDIVERGKIRHIQAVHISERVVQKLHNKYAILPMIQGRIIGDNSASQKGKGTDYALKRLKEHIRWHYARFGKRGAIAVMDFKDFFGSMPHDAVISMMNHYQEDKLIQLYTKRFINAFDGDQGLGLGSEISQSCAVFYPTPIDKFIKETLKIHCFARYNDDSYIIHEDRKYVEYCIGEIRKKAAEYGLELHEEKTKIHNLASDDFRFLKKRIHICENGKIIMRLERKNLQRERTRIAQQKAEYERGSIPLKSILNSYQCWRNYAQTYNAHYEVGKMDRYFMESFGAAINKEIGGGKVNFRRPKI